MTQRRATIRDVAKSAGVSPAAVSKVLNEGYGVSTQMRQRVLQVVEELGYRPSAAARSLRGRSHTIGVLADIRSPIVAQVVDGIEDEIAKSSLDVLLSPVGGNDNEQRRIDAMLNRNVEGLILIAPNLAHDALEALGASVPTVLIGRHGGGRTFDSVMDDDLAGATLAVEHLVELGHRRIAHITMKQGKLRRPSVLPHTARNDGYERTMKERGLEPSIIVTEYTEDGGYRGALTALAQDPPPTAIFAGTDVVALGVLRATHELGLTVPGDLSIVGADNLPIGALPQISLTTIDPSGRLNGSTSARLLRERIEGREKPITHAITPSLVVRGSTAPPNPARRETR